MQDGIFYHGKYYSIEELEQIIKDVAMKMKAAGEL